MVKAKLTPQMKKFIEKNVELSNRFLSERITDNYNIKVSHVIVGRHKKSFLETGLETKLEISETSSNESIPIIIESNGNISQTNYVELQALLDTFFKIAWNRVGGKVSCNKLGRELLDSIIEKVTISG